MSIKKHNFLQSQSPVVGHRVLMATNALDLGGAETHIVELASGLTRLGYEVTVASNGGRYVAELAAAGVNHCQQPLHQRSVWSMLRSFIALLRLVRREKPQLLHAHARIPAFILRLISALTGTPVVTTVHWPFDLTGWQRYVTWWSPHSIVVSEDLRNYLVQEFGFNPQQVAIIPNGINTERYAPAPSSWPQTIPTTISAVYQEFGWQPGDVVVIYVSRLTGQIAGPAFSLLQAAQSLGQEIPALRVLIVGDGDQRESLQEQAVKVNRQLGRQLVTIAGPRTDLPRLLPAATAFVGVSRAALEAMSCERPVILAGSQGYLGIFSAEILDEAIRTNFTGRDHPAVTAAALEKDLRRLLLEFSPDTRTQLGRLGRQIVEEHYSAWKMVRMTHEFYQRVIKGEPT
ncbi:MAG: glycosyltransferase [Bacillota bacterium]